jgi:hypothetical protein
VAVRSRSDGTTLVTISNWGFRGSDDEVLKQVLDSMGGFSFLLAGLKALLEHNVALNLVGDHHPDPTRLIGKRGCSHATPILKRFLFLRIITFTHAQKRD